jgi:aminoglycoside phosphotransferase (APT) family kinase protein
MTVGCLASGKSNEMFVVTRGAARVVIRRPAALALDGADAGMRREFRVLQALDGTAVPHARPIALCDDPHVLGTVFYAMEHVDGFLPTEPIPEELADAAGRREIALAVVDALADLHSVDWRAAGLDDFGRPDGFHERQRDRWLRQYRDYAAQELDGIEAIGDWLTAHIPAEWSPTIMHGDYHMANLLMTRARPTRVAAICDWETTTIGDPLLDLAGFLRIWFEAHAEGPWPDRATMIARYAERAGRATPDLTYYTVLAGFRLAITIEGIYQRSKADPTRPLATDLHTYAGWLVVQAQAATAGSPG